MHACMQSIFFQILIWHPLVKSTYELSRKLSANGLSFVSSCKANHIEVLSRGKQEGWWRQIGYAYKSSCCGPDTVKSKASWKPAMCALHWMVAGHPRMPSAMSIFKSKILSWVLQQPLLLCLMLSSHCWTSHLPANCLRHGFVPTWIWKT